MELISISPTVQRVLDPGPAPLGTVLNPTTFVGLISLKVCQSHTLTPDQKGFSAFEGGLGNSLQQGCNLGHLGGCSSLGTSPTPHGELTPQTWSGLTGPLSLLQNQWQFYSLKSQINETRFAYELSI